MTNPKKWQHSIGRWCWTLFCFTITFVAGTDFLVRHYIQMIGMALSEDYNKGLFTRIDALGRMVDKTSSILCQWMSFLWMALKLRHVLAQLCHDLQWLDDQKLIRQPDLSFLRKYSIVATLWMILTVTQSLNYN